MTFIDTNKLPTIERLPGWRGRYFDSASDYARSVRRAET